MKFLKILGIATKTGTVTVRYPYQEPLITPEFRGRIVIDAEKCIGCGACVRICPPKALTEADEGGSKIIRYFIGRCIFCGMCVDTCPQNAIQLTREFELATDNILDLYDDVEHERASCTRCGKYYLTKKLLDKVVSNVERIASDRVVMCPECRRIETVSRIASRILGVPK